MRRQIGWAIALAIFVAGCQEDAKPSASRETGYLSCETMSADCDGGLRCFNEGGDATCVAAPAGCAAQDCACVGEEVCGDRVCRAEDEGARLVCDDADVPDAAGNDR